MRLPRLHAITDDAVLGAPGFPERVEALMAELGAALALHLRGHGLGGAALYRLAGRLRPMASGAGGLFLVNDRVDVALAAGVSAVQLGCRSLPLSAARRLMGDGAWIGCSVHGGAEAAEAAAAGADFVVAGTVYPTGSHPGEPGAGLARVREVAAAVRVPIIAIGGITPAAVGDVCGAGAYGVAVLTGVWSARDPVAAARGYLEALEEVRP